MIYNIKNEVWEIAEEYAFVEIAKIKKPKTNKIRLSFKKNSSPKELSQTTT
jgi:hypothetical protein